MSPKAVPNDEFETACSLWRMEFAFHTFRAVRAGIERFLERKLHSDEPEYYPMLVGLICLYARPFTNNRPVGPLTDDIVPQEHRELHQTIIKMRHQLFAHGDASAMTRPDDYPNELVFVNDGKSLRFQRGEECRSGKSLNACYPTCAFLRCDLDLMRVGGSIQ